MQARPVFLCSQQLPKGNFCLVGVPSSLWLLQCKYIQNSWNFLSFPRYMSSFFKDLDEKSRAQMNWNMQTVKEYE